MSYFSQNWHCKGVNNLKIKAAIGVHIGGEHP